MEKVKDFNWQKDCQYKLGDGFPCHGPAFIAVDIETTGLNPEIDTIVGVSIALEKGVAQYLPVAHSQYVNNIPLSTVIVMLQMFIDHGSTLVYFNAKFDRAFLNKAGLRDGSHWRDAQIDLYAVAAHLFQGSAGLKGLAKKILGYDMLDLHEVFGVSKAELSRNPVNFANLPVDSKTLSYACADADMTLRLFEWAKSKMTPKLQVVSDRDHALIPAIRQMEMNGIHIDQDALLNLSTMLQDERTKLGSALTSKLGKECNLGSPKQLRIHLFEKLGLRSETKTKKGDLSTSTTALKALQRRYGKKHPEITWLIEYRKLDTLSKSFLKPIAGGIKPGISRIYPQFKAASLVTGRIASTGDGTYLKKLNFQGIPKNLSESGFNIRRIFCASPGYTWVSIDLASIEPRLIAEFSRDEGLLEAFATEGADLYTPLAEYLFRKPSTDPDFKRLRKIAKIVLLASFYSFGVTSIKTNIEAEIGKKVAENYVWGLRERLEERFPKWVQLRESQMKEARKEGYSTSYFGRRRYVGEFYQTANFLGSAGDRLAVNHPIQSTAADLMRYAIIRIARYIDTQPKDEIRMLSTVHDELNFEVLTSKLDEHVPTLVKHMTWAPKNWLVPIRASVEVGPNWGELRTYEQ